MIIVDISKILYKDDKQWSINILKENGKIYTIREFGKIGSNLRYYKKEILKSRYIIRNGKKYIRFVIEIKPNIFGFINPYKYIIKNSLITNNGHHIIIEKAVNYVENIIEEYAFLEAEGQWLRQVIIGFDRINQNTAI